MTVKIRAPRGPQISCKGWQQEAALRMLMNNLDPDVAERPEDLVVYGGRGLPHAIGIVITPSWNPCARSKGMRPCSCSPENPSPFSNLTQMPRVF